MDGQRATMFVAGNGPNDDRSEPHEPIGFDLPDLRARVCGPRHALARLHDGAPFHTTNEPQSGAGEPSRERLPTKAGGTMSTDWTADYATNNYVSSDGWTLARNAEGQWDIDGDYTWDVVDPDGRTRVACCVSVTDAQRHADRLRFQRTGMAGCPFCGAGPEDDDYDDCVTRRLSPGDAARMAQSFADHADELRAKADTLWALAGVERINAAS